MKTIFQGIVVFVIGATLFLFFGLRIWIKSDVKQVCESAMNKFEGNKKEALLLVLKSDSIALREKNKAIWALGHLKDTTALPFLRTLRMGEECNHDKFVCQIELTKTIQNLEGKSLNLIKFN